MSVQCEWVLYMQNAFSCNAHEINQQAFSLGGVVEATHKMVFAKDLSRTMHYLYILSASQYNSSVQYIA